MAAERDTDWLIRAVVDWMFAADLAWRIDRVLSDAEALEVAARLRWRAATLGLPIRSIQHVLNVGRLCAEAAEWARQVGLRPARTLGTSMDNSRRFARAVFEALPPHRAVECMAAVLENALTARWLRPHRRQAGEKLLAMVRERLAEKIAV